MLRATSDEDVKILQDAIQGYDAKFNMADITDIRLDDMVLASDYSGAYTAYVLRVEPFGLLCTKRYSQFHDLWKKLQVYLKKSSGTSPSGLLGMFASKWGTDELGDASVKIPVMPPKSVLNQFDNVFLEQRKRALELFVNDVLKHPMLRDRAEFYTFLFGDGLQWYTVITTSEVEQFENLFTLQGASEEENKYSQEASQLLIEDALRPNALATFQSHYKCSPSVKDLETQCTRLFLIGMYTQCIEFCAKSRENLKNDKFGMAYVTMMLGMCFKETKSFEKSLEYSLSALDLLTAAQHPFYLADCLNLVAGTFKILGDFEKSVEYFEEALGLTEQIQYMQGYATTLILLAKMYIDARQFQKAIVLLQDALKKDNFVSERSAALKLLATSYMETYNLEMAATTLTKATAWAKSTQNQQSFNECIAVNGELSRRNKDLKTALQSFRFCLAHFMKGDEKFGIRDMCMSIGAIYYDNSDLYTAMKYFQIAVTTAFDQNDIYAYYKSNVYIAAIFMQLTKPSLACKNLAAALNAIDIVTKYPTVPHNYNMYYFSDMERTADIAMECICKLDDNVLKLELVERQRSIILEHGLLKNLEKCPRFIGVPDIWKNGKQLIKADIFNVSAKLSACIVYYGLVDERLLYIWVVDAKANAKTLVDYVEVNLETELGKNKLDSIMFLLATRYSKHTVSEQSLAAMENQYLYKLYKVLIAPVRKHFPANRLVIFVPHKILLNVPFAALYDATSGKYLVEECTFIIAKSIGMLYLQNMCLMSKTESHPVLLVGNPMVPTQCKHQCKQHFEEELKNISTLLGDANFTSLSHEHAKKQLTISMIKQSFNILHLIVPITAMEYPPSSMIEKYQPVGALVLAHPQANSQAPNAITNIVQDEEYMLYAAEIGKLQLFDCTLCILEDCKLATKKRLTGELTIYDSFSMAGAESCLVSLLPMRTIRVTLMHHFYGFLVQDTKFAAFRTALLNTIKELNIRYTIVSID